MFKGQFSASLFYKISAPIAIFSLITIYYQSQYYHHQPPFPKRTISQVAQHFPEFVVFRLATITNSVLNFLGWQTNHFFLQTIAVEAGINIKKYHTEVPLFIGIMGCLLLMGSTAFIDTGDFHETFHVICATSFFITTILAQVLNTIIFVKMHQKTNLISKYSLYSKYFVVFLLAVQGIYGNVKEYLMGVRDDKGNFLEWTLTATVISMFISMAFDVSKYQFVFVDSSRTQPAVNQHQNLALQSLE